MTSSESIASSVSAQVLLHGLAAALFDLDNTLIETHIDFPQMKRETLTLAARHGAALAPLEERDILDVVEGAAAQLRRTHGDEAAARYHAEAGALLARIEAAQCADPVFLPGAAEMLTALRAAEVPVAIVTRNCRSVSEQLIAAGRLTCDALLAREDVARVKPHPDHLRAALHRLADLHSPIDTVDPARCLMVGDHWIDVQAGRAAGLRTVGLRRGHGDQAFAPAPPDLLLDDMAELWALWQRATAL